MDDNAVAYRVLLAAHRVADEFDEIDSYPWARLGGVSLGGVIRHEVHEAYEVDMDACPACKQISKEANDIRQEST